MLFKICDLVIFTFLFILLGCSDNNKEMEYEELDRMAKENTQPSQHQNIAEESPIIEGSSSLR